MTNTNLIVTLLTATVAALVFAFDPVPLLAGFAHERAAVAALDAEIDF